MDDDESKKSGILGKDFSHNDEQVSFERLKNFGKEDIKRLQYGFGQTLIYAIHGNENFDPFVTWENYNIFINNLKLLKINYDKKRDELIRKIYNEECLVTQ